MKPMDKGAGKPSPKVVEMAGYRRPEGREKRTPVWKHIALIIVVTFAAYFNALGNGFVGDDLSFVEYNTSIRDTSNIPEYFFSPKTLASADSEWGTVIYRPLRTVSYAIDYSLYGLRAEGYHVTSLLLHMAACVTLYLLVLAMLESQAVALLSALIFALHPLHTEAVSWIASRADLIGFVFLNLSLLAYVRYRKAAGGGALLALSVVLSLLAYLGKETMVSLPGMVIAYDYAARGRKSLRETVRGSLPAWVLFAVVCLAYLVLRYSVTGRMSTDQGWWGGSAYSNFLMMAEATAAYLRLMVLPWGLTFHYLIDPVHTVLDARVLVSLAIILASVVAIVWSHRRNRLAFFLLLWFYLALVPIANIVPISFSMMAERYIYMASAGPIVAGAWGLVYLYRRAAGRGRLYGGAVAGVVVLGLVAATAAVIDRNRDYADEFAFYSAAVAVSPESPPSNKGLADQYFKRKEYGRAIEYYEKALAGDPGYVEALLGEVAVYREKGEPGAALAAANRALAVGRKVPLKKARSAMIRFNLGNVYKDMGDIERARVEWERAVELNPDYPEAWTHLGNYYQLSGDYARALSMYERSLRLNPYNAEVNYNAAIIYEARGEKEKAARHYRAFLRNAGPEYRDVVEEVRKRHL
ncbi:MAG: tetratricopeptide repeat protein [Thermodesulfobacteriota bacterium]